MQLNKLILIVIFSIAGFCSNAQEKTSLIEADINSYKLYEYGKWDELIKYGDRLLSNKQDFMYLRLRIGYANIMKQNYSMALKHYYKALSLSKDKNNAIAHYYIWVCLNNLNQPELAQLEFPYLSSEVKRIEKIKKIALYSESIEISNKMTDVATRNNALFTKVSLHTSIGSRLNMTHSFLTYNQNINEDSLVLIKNNNSIYINQKEYYNKSTFNINHQWQLKAAYHFLYAPFNSLLYSPYTDVTYKDNLFMLGLKYNRTFFTLQGSVVLGKLSDSSLHQYNIQAEYFPLGNTNIYGVSTVSMRDWSDSRILNLKQVVGKKINDKIWIEGNITMGEFSKYVENDLLYVYNTIDKNTLKAGINIYLFSGKHALAQMGYSYEQLKLFNRTYLFNQHSIIGGITWKF